MLFHLGNLILFCSHRSKSQLARGSHDGLTGSGNIEAAGFEMGANTV